jgi:hypothetical protein
VKAIYLDQKGEMPEPEAKAVSRRISRFFRRHRRREDPAAAATSPAPERAPH